MTSSWHRKVDRLFKKATAGDKRACGELYDATAMHLLAMAHCLCNDGFLCEEAVAETFLTIFRGGSNFDDSKHAYPWMTGILRNKIRQLTDKRYFPQTISEELEMAENAVFREDDIDLYAALNALCKGDRYCLVGYYFYGYSQKELAAAAGITVSAMSKRIKAAEQRLKKLLQ